jgi:hypothetical protein
MLVYRIIYKTVFATHKLQISLRCENYEVISGGSNTYKYIRRHYVLRNNKHNQSYRIKRQIGLENYAEIK